SEDKGQGTRDKGQGTRDEGRGTRDEGRGTRDEGNGGPQGATEAACAPPASPRDCGNRRHGRRLAGRCPSCLADRRSRTGRWPRRVSMVPNLTNGQVWLRVAHVIDGEPFGPTRPRGAFGRS